MTILHHTLNTVLMTTKLINNVLPSKRERERERGREEEREKGREEERERGREEERENGKEKETIK